MNHGFDDSQADLDTFFGLPEDAHAEHTPTRGDEPFLGPPSDNEVTLPFSQAPVQTPPKRRRLSEKQAPPEYYLSLSPASTEASTTTPTTMSASPEQLSFSDLHLECSQMDRDLYKSFHGYMRRWLGPQRPGTTAQDRAEERHLAQPFRCLTTDAKLDLVRRWSETDASAPAETKKAVLAYYQGKVDNKSTDYAWFHARQMLLTWNGPWGLFPLEVAGGEFVDIDTLTSRLQSAPEVLALRNLVQEWMEKKDAEMRFQEHVWSLEVATKTYEAARQAHSEASRRLEPLALTTGATASSSAAPATALSDLEKPIRLHLHGYFRFSSRVHIRSSSTFLFQGSHPVQSSVTMAAGGRSRAMGNQGLYYVQAPKIGSVFVGGSTKPFEGYLINADWIFNLCQQRKMLLSVAKKELVKVGKGLPRHCEVLARWVQEKDNEELEEHIAAIQRQLAANARPQVSLSPPVAAWLESFSEVKFRYSFLVLDGPSRMGKTVYARHLAGDPMSVLEIDCTGTVFPDLRSFRPMVHKFIIYDECSPGLVLQNRKLFQSSASWITLGSSSTNCLSYKIWAHAVRMVVTSNSFRQECEMLPAGEVRWLEANCVYVNVDAPLWQCGS